MLLRIIMVVLLVVLLWNLRVPYLESYFDEWINVDSCFIGSSYPCSLFSLPVSHQAAQFVVVACPLVNCFVNPSYSAVSER